MSLAMQIVVSLAVFLILGLLSSYMLYTSEKEAKRLLNLKKAWHPNRMIADEPAELARIRLGVIILYAGVLAVSLWMFHKGFMVLMEVRNRNLAAEQEGQVVMLDGTSSDGHEAGATVSVMPRGAEQAARPVNQTTASPTDEEHIRPPSQSTPRQQARTDSGEASMVLIPGGTFWMGISDDERDRAIEECKGELTKQPSACTGWVLSAQPRHQVTLDPFSLDPYEVTNSQFKKFVQATSYQTTAEREGTAFVWTNSQLGWQETKGATWRQPEAGPDVFASDRADHPVVNVSWHDAEAYCRWAGKRLPTEAEFEYATRAGTQTTYWWGNFSPGTRQVANVADESGRTLLPAVITGYNDGYVTTAPVGSYEANPFGLFDMTGNVAEWTADWSDGFYYRTSPERNPTGPSSGDSRMTRGGGWSDGSYRIRPTARDGILPTERGTKVGFRCAQGVRATSEAGRHHEAQRKDRMTLLRWFTETFSLWIAGLCVAMIPVWVLYLSKADQMARAQVELSRHKWESTSDFETEFLKVRFQLRRIFFMFIVMLVIGAIVIICAHVLVQS